MQELNFEEEKCCGPTWRRTSLRIASGRVLKLKVRELIEITIQ